MFNGESWLTTAIRWSLLIDAIVASLFALLTAFKCPVWLHWAVGMVVPECALWFTLLPVCIATGGWWLRRGHPVITIATLSLCSVAFLLFLKPTVQAWRLGRAVPAQLAAAFGPATPQRPPFSISAAVLPRAP